MLLLPTGAEEVHDMLAAGVEKLCGSDAGEPHRPNRLRAHQAGPRLASAAASACSNLPHPLLKQA